jgi:hypothetical protein
MKKVFVAVLLSAVLLTSFSFAGGFLQPPQNMVKKAFPYSIAGFGCWVTLPSSPNLKKIGEMFQQIEGAGQNYIYGWLTVSGIVNTKVYLYADSNGYLVSFLNKNTPPAGIIGWQFVNFANKEVTNFTITKVLNDALDKLEVTSTKVYNDIKFTDFQHPKANRFAVALTYAPKSVENMHVACPEKVKFFSWSGRFYSNLFDNRYGGRVYFDNTSANWYSRKNDVLKFIWKDEDTSTTFNPFHPHTFTLKADYDNYKAAIPRFAVVMVYQLPEEVKGGTTK